jgi:hypothetical protein
MDWLLEQLRKEARVIKKAPLSFTTACVLLLVSAYLFNYWVFNERLAARDDMLSYYREKLGLLPLDKTRYSGLRNPELKAEALAMVGRIRAIQNQDKEETRRLIQASLREASGKTDQERWELVQRLTEQSLASMYKALDAYNQNLKVDEVLLQGEILSRLNRENRLKFSPHLKEEDIPIHTRLGMVADRLEAMAKLLPESGN